MRIRMKEAAARMFAYINKTYIPEIDQITNTKTVLLCQPMESSANEWKLYSLIDNSLIASFVLADMPGCCGISISTQANVYPKFRNRGLGLLLNRVRIDIATQLGYGLLICTSLEMSDPQQKILKHNGWSKLLSFRNPRTNNVVCLHAIELHKNYEALLKGEYK